MSNKSKKRFFIIDGNSFCYRAYYAIKHLANSKGQPTNAIYGVISMIKKIISDEKPDMIAVAFDLKGPTFRHEKYENYKVTRKPMPDDLVSQIPYIKKVITGYNIPIFEMTGYEADDVIATLTEFAKESGVESYIVTGDKDMLQLVDPDVKVYSPGKEKVIYDEERVFFRFGISPKQITDLMALMGDSSDNIPGVLGIGEKTAVGLMKEFESLDNILKNTQKIKSDSMRKKIESSKEIALLSRELATVRRDVPIDIKLSELDRKDPDNEALAILFKELEFGRLLKDVAEKRKPSDAYKIVDNEKGLKKMIQMLKHAKTFAFDFETTHWDPMRARAVGVSFCSKENEAYYVPFNALSGITQKRVVEQLKRIFEDESIKKTGQNIKYDLLILKNLGVHLQGVEFDTMVASYVLNPSKSRHNLNDIAVEHLGRTKGAIEDLIGKGKKAVTMDQIDVDKVCDYCCEDSDITFSLRGVLKKKLNDKDLYDLFSKVEMPLVNVLADMEASGVSLDEKYLSGLSQEIAEEIATLEKNIYSLASEEFNINSSKQLRLILFEKLKMPVIKRTKTGPSTDEGVLRVLAEKEPLPKELLRYRTLSKLKSTYVDSLPALINKSTGRIHTSFNQTITATGRLSSSNPNLQNIPIRTVMGRKIRKAFVAENKMHLILSCDYSQIELRILAHLSGDEVLTKAFIDDRDIHKFTASLVYGVSEDDVTKEMRVSAKTVNFGIVYGMSAYGLSRDLGIDVAVAAKFIESYFNRYPRVKEYLDEKIEEAKNKGFVTTMLGRRRYIPEINSSNAAVSNFAKRTAVNTPIQGSAADLIKLAMIDVHKKLSAFDTKMIMQVHDELVFEIDKKELKEFAGVVKNSMENVMKLDVPIKVRLLAGKNWLEMEQVKL